MDSNFIESAWARYDILHHFTLILYTESRLELISYSDVDFLCTQKKIRHADVTEHSKIGDTNVDTLCMKVWLFCWFKQVKLLNNHGAFESVSVTEHFLWFIISISFELIKMA